MRAQTIPLEAKFSRGFSKTKGDNNVPIAYASIVRNLRIQDNGIQPRAGYSKIFQGETKDMQNGLVAYEKTNRLFRCIDDRFEEINYSVGTITDRSNSLQLPTGKKRFIVYDKYIVILTGTTKPYIFNVDTNVLALSTTQINDNVYPHIGGIFSGYTFVAFQNKLFVSKPITLGNEINATIRNSSNTDCRQIVYNSNILGLFSAFDRLRVFTETNIEFIDATTVNTVGATVNIYSQKFASDQRIVNPDCIIGAGSKIFFITTGKKIRAIGYYQGVAQLQIGDVSDIPLVGIDEYMQSDLDSDLSECVGIFDDKKNLLKWSVKGRGQATNDRLVIYDLINKGFIIDDNKFFSEMVTLNDKIYACGAFSNDKVYQDEVGGSDDGQPISCQYKTHGIKLGVPADVKFFRGQKFSGKVNKFTNGTVQGFVDDRIVTKLLPLIVDNTGNNIDNNGIAGSPIAGSPIAGSPIAGDINVSVPVLKSFSRIIDASHIRKKGLSNAWDFQFSGKNMDFVIDYMALFAIPLGKYRLSDKF